MPRRLVAAVAVLCVAGGAFTPAAAQPIPGPLADLQAQLASYASGAPGRIAVAVEDPASGFVTGVNAGSEMPAASTIKVPVMVEVFRQLADRNFDLNTRLTLRAADKDWGSGDLCDAPVGSSYPVSRLLAVMIDDSDNTATNMLIRLVGRQNINTEMVHLGLTHTRLGDFIRTSTDAVRTALRSSPADMTHLLTQMAKERLVDEWSSREMIAIMTHQHINTLLPVPLPPGTTIAHKTGSLHDTLNDVGIVYPTEDQPYVIAVMTTALPALEPGRRFIRAVSKLAFTAFNRVGALRSSNPLDPLMSPGEADHATPLGDQSTTLPAPQPHATAAPATAHDARMWTPPAPPVPAPTP